MSISQDGRWAIFTSNFNGPKYTSAVVGDIDVTKRDVYLIKLPKMCQ